MCGLELLSSPLDLWTRLGLSHLQGLPASPSLVPVAEGRWGCFSFPGADVSALNRTQPTISPKKPLSNSHSKIKTVRKQATAAFLGEPEIASRAPRLPVEASACLCLGPGAAGDVASFPWLSWRDLQATVCLWRGGLSPATKSLALLLQGLGPSPALHSARCPLSTG